MEIKKKEVREVVPKYSKEQLLLSKKFDDKRDILNVVLCDNRTYSLNEVNALIEKFLKGRVK